MTPPKILILGDIESESEENIEIDLELPKWGLLQKFAMPLNYRIMKSHLFDSLPLMLSTSQTAQTFKITWSTLIQNSSLFSAHGR